jgi:hypothetical protein
MPDIDRCTAECAACTPGVDERMASICSGIVSELGPAKSSDFADLSQFDSTAAELYLPIVKATEILDLGPFSTVVDDESGAVSSAIYAANTLDVNEGALGLIW